MNNEYKERLLLEYTGLTIRKEKLNDFIVSEKFKEMKNQEYKDLLCRQLETMSLYHEILEKRIYIEMCGGLND